MITQNDIRAILRAECDKAGTIKAWSEANNLTPTFVSDVIRGTRPVTGKLAQRFGYERIILFQAQDNACNAKNDGA